MKGNKEFRESQKAADKQSNAKAKKIMEESDIAQAYFQTVRSTSGDERCAKKGKK
jgi:hypothetical protein